MIVILTLQITVDKNYKHIRIWTMATVVEAYKRIGRLQAIVWIILWRCSRQSIVSIEDLLKLYHRQSLIYVILMSQQSLFKFY
jgi:hypothetical protein